MADDPEDGEGGDDLAPLTLRQKVANKAFNKALDRRLNYYAAITLALVGLGAIREVYEFVEDGTFDVWVFGLSLLIGLGGFEFTAYVSGRSTRRED